VHLGLLVLMQVGFVLEWAEELVGDLVGDLEVYLVGKHLIGLALC